MERKATSRLKGVSMVNLEEILYNKVMGVMSTWCEQDIYAVSFFVESNELLSFQDVYNVSGFSISYNTESDCEGVGLHSERRWNYAFWRQDVTEIIEPRDDSPEMELLFAWYKEQGIENIGEETIDSCDGPVGYVELVNLVAKVARRIQEEQFLVKKFGRPIPIIIHDLEYIDCTLKATEYANLHGEAADFLAGNWESEDDMSPMELASAQKLISEIVNDPMNMKRLLDSSPWFPEEDVIRILKMMDEKNRACQ